MEDMHMHLKKGVTDISIMQKYVEKCKEMKLNRVLFLDHGNRMSPKHTPVLNETKVIDKFFENIKIVKENKKYNEAILIDLVKSSSERIDAPCPYFGICGGCSLQTLPYDLGISYKKDKVINYFKKMGLIINPSLITNDTPYNYRNKAQYPVGTNKNGEKVFGVFAKRTHEIIPIKECKIQKEISYEIANYILDYIKKNNISVYNEKKQTGLVRHIVTKVGIQTNEIMCIIVINGKELPHELTLANNIIDKFPMVKQL